MLSWSSCAAPKNLHAHIQMPEPWIRGIAKCSNPEAVKLQDAKMDSNKHHTHKPSNTGQNIDKL